MEKNEDDFTAAVRETREETGLIENRDFEFASKNFTVQSIFMNEIKHKRIIFWLAKVKDFNVTIVLSHEHSGFKWSSLTDAISEFRNEDMKRAFKEADCFLESKVNNENKIPLE